MEWIMLNRDENVFVYTLLAGMVLDACFGDPVWFPHPVKFYGKAVLYFDQKFNTGQNRKMKGGLVTIFLILLVWLLFAWLEIRFAQNAIYLVFQVVLFYSAIANRSLIMESLKVEREVIKGNLKEARKKLSFIVGRDTKNLSKNEIRKAILETLSENLSDAVIAPLFYYLLGGLPLMLSYKMVNTLDSMIGYRNEKYNDFGYLAAKTDDLFNLIPARLTALLMIIITLNYRGLTYIFKYAPLHASPNAGYPEAALAGILNCSLGGPAYYHGKLHQKAMLGENNRNVIHKDIISACAINVGVSMGMTLLIMLIFTFLKF